MDNTVPRYVRIFLNADSLHLRNYEVGDRLLQVGEVKVPWDWEDPRILAGVLELYGGDWRPLGHTTRAFRVGDVVSIDGTDYPRIWSYEFAGWRNLGLGLGSSHCNPVSSNIEDLLQKG